MTPFLTADNAAEGNAAASYDLTALTSPGGAWDIKQGFVGSDWICFQNTTFTSNPKQKTDGNNQLAITVSASSTGNSALKTVNWTTSDEIQGASGGGNQCTAVNGAIGDFVQFASIPADQNIRTLHWRGANLGCGSPGTWQVTASLGDSSAAPITPFNLPTGNCGFKLQFAAAADPRTPTNLTLKIACLAAPSGPHTAYLFCQLLWLEIPVSAVPRGAKRYFLGRSLGGRLA